MAFGNNRLAATFRFARLHGSDKSQIIVDLNNDESVIVSFGWLFGPVVLREEFSRFFYAGETGASAAYPPRREIRCRSVPLGRRSDTTRAVALRTETRKWRLCTRFVSSRPSSERSSTTATRVSGPVRTLKMSANITGRRRITVRVNTHVPIGRPEFSIGEPTTAHGVLVPKRGLWLNVENYKTFPLSPCIVYTTPAYEIDKNLTNANYVTTRNRILVRKLEQI